MIIDPRIYTVESVTAGHPDKICDQISDAILDECLRQDLSSRVAVEAAGGHGLLQIFGEVTTKANVDYAEVARRVYREIGYTDDLKIITNIVAQSPDIALGVDTGGAGDQGIMYGYATDETPEMLPAGVVIAHAVAKKLEELRTSGTLPWLRPDGKTQITMVAGKMKTILISTQHAAEINYEQLYQELVPHIMHFVMTKFVKFMPNTKTTQLNFLVNPTGQFIQGGFEADTGLTGRKIMVDTYGGLAPHGGGAFSGKDATKVDRSAAYMARFGAKNLVSRGLAKQCLVSVSYAIGQADPLMVEALDESGNSIPEISEFDFRPRAIIEFLGLNQPIFRQTAAYGHFGREVSPWEKVSKQYRPAIIGI